MSITCDANIEIQDPWIVGGGRQRILAHGRVGVYEPSALDRYLQMPYSDKLYLLALIRSQDGETSGHIALPEDGSLLGNGRLERERLQRLECLESIKRTDVITVNEEVRESKPTTTDLDYRGSYDIHVAVTGESDSDAEELEGALFSDLQRGAMFLEIADIAQLVSNLEDAVLYHYAISCQKRFHFFFPPEFIVNATAAVRNCYQWTMSITGFCHALWLCCHIMNDEFRRTRRNVANSNGATVDDLNKLRRRIGICFNNVCQSMASYPSRAPNDLPNNPFESIPPLPVHDLLFSEALEMKYGWHSVSHGGLIRSIIKDDQ